MEGYLQHDAFYVSTVDGRYPALSSNGGLHMRLLHDAVLIPGHRCLITLAGSLHLPRGYFTVSRLSCYAPSFLRGMLDAVYFSSTADQPVLGFYLHPLFPHDVLLPAGTVMVQFHLYECTINGCDHLSGHCM